MRLAAILLAIVPAFAQSPVDGPAARLRDLVRKNPDAANVEMEMMAAQALAARHPEAARTVNEEAIRAARNFMPPADLLRSLVQNGSFDAAISLYREEARKGNLWTQPAGLLFARLNREQPARAADLFQNVASEVPVETLSPADVLWLVNTAEPYAASMPAVVANLCERILKTASASDYGKSASLEATFRSDAGTIHTTNARDTVLVAAGARLRQTAPDRMARFQTMLGAWDLSRPLKPASPQGTLQIAAAGTGMVSSALQPPPISQRMGTMRSLPNDAARAELAIELARQIQTQPAGPSKLGLARSLANLATEGDLGMPALTAVAEALADAIRDSHGGSADILELAKLARYENAKLTKPVPGLDAANELLLLREGLVDETGFALTALDGKAYSLPELHGKVVLLNFWATWCPPCRKEMPDMEKLYREFANRGLVVLAVSDEERATVEKFLKDKDYTFPVLLDPGRKVNTAFQIEGIPKSFLFDREGKLAALAIDMRTESQFRLLLRRAGL